jgi:segregation and condensation protein B
MSDHSEQPSSSPLSLSRLREAFAAMLSPDPGDAPPLQAAGAERGPAATVDPAGDGRDPCEISPRSVVEAMLFVGHPDGRPLSARQMAAAMRGVSPREIDAAVAELNARYLQDAAPYEIAGSARGYQLKLRDEFGRVRDKFHGQVREAKLSPAAVEVLSVVAYNQPVTADQISRLRSAPSGSILATLVRRRLVRLERPADRRTGPAYRTTDRFLRLFGLASADALPRSEELEKA